MYNEEAVLPELLSRVLAILDEIPGDDHELILVDDGSRDATATLITEAADRDRRVRGVSLSRNFGHQAAVTAALEESRGDVVVIMDGDLQDRPEAIPTLLDHWRQGYDVVYARRRRRKESWPLRASYFLFYRLLGRLADHPLPTDAGDFALLSRRVVDELVALPEHNRYLRGLRAWVGFPQIGIDVERDERRAGRPKYSLRGLLGLAFDGIFAFSLVPLRAASVLGALTILGSSGYALYAVLVKLLLDRSPQGFTALVVALVFLSGVQLLFLGVVGEYVGRVYREVKGRPAYIVARRIGGDAPPG